MEVVAIYGPMIVAAVICEAAGFVVSFFLAYGRSDSDDSVPRPWDGILFWSVAVPTVVAGIGAAALVGPSSDLAHFSRSVVGVLCGLVAYGIIALAGIISAPDQYRIVTADGRTMVDAEAIAYKQQYGKDGDAEAREYLRQHPGASRSWGTGPRAGWRPSAGLIAGNVLLLWIVSPAIGITIAVVVAGSWIATIGAILALGGLLAWFFRGS